MIHIEKALSQLKEIEKQVDSHIKYIPARDYHIADALEHTAIALQNICKILLNLEERIKQLENK